MGRITALFIRKVIDAVQGNFDRAALLSHVGLSPEDPIDPARMVADTDYYTFFEQAAAADADGTTLPLRVGASMLCDDYGAFGLAWKSALDLRGSYARAERYAQVLTSVSAYQVERTNDGAFMHLHRAGERRLGMRLSNEATLASIVSISQQVTTQDRPPLAIHVKHPAPGSVDGHLAHFGCPVYFESDRDAVHVSDEALMTPNKLGDESISRFFEQHLATEVSKLDDESSLPHRVRARISRSLSEGVPAISEIASHFGMSGRTLQRRLSDRGVSFQEMIDAARRTTAERLLAQTEYSLAEVAFMTGFSEQSSFTRAFKRWAGQTPRSYRLEAIPE